MTNQIEVTQLVIITLIATIAIGMALWIIYKIFINR